MNTPIAPDAALEAEILSVVEASLPRLQSLLSTLVGFPSLLGGIAVEEHLRHVAAVDPRLHGAALFLARWCGVEQA